MLSVAVGITSLLPASAAEVTSVAWRCSRREARTRLQKLAACVKWSTGLAPC